MKLYDKKQSPFRLLIICIIGFIGFVLIRCSVNVDGTVHHVIEIDNTKLEKYFIAKCEKEMPGASEADIQLCSNNYIADFMDSVVGKK